MQIQFKHLWKACDSMATKIIDCQQRYGSDKLTSRESVLRKFIKFTVSRLMQVTQTSEHLIYVMLSHVDKLCYHRMFSLILS